MCGYFYIGFIDFMLKGKSLLDYTNLFSPNECKNNDKTILKYFQQNLNKLKCIAMFETSIKNLKILNIKNLKKTLSLSIVCSSCGYECGRIFKGEASTEILKIIGLINNIEDYQKYVIMSEENVSQEFRLKNLDETRNY